MKYCPTCQQSKTRDDFHKNSSTKSGLASLCKDCRAKIGEKYRSANKNRKVCSISYPTFKRCYKCDCTKEMSDFYKNKSRIDGLHNSCKQCCKEYMKEYRVSNSDKYRAYNIKRKAIKANAFIGGAVAMRIIKNFHTIAVLLTKEYGYPFHVDHIQPISKGGDHHPLNLQIIDATTNLRKGDRWPL